MIGQVPYNGSMRGLILTVGAASLVVSSGCRSGSAQFVAPKVEVASLLSAIPDELRHDPPKIADESNRWIAMHKILAVAPKVEAKYRAGFERVLSNPEEAADPDARESFDSAIRALEPTFAQLSEAMRKPHSAIGELQGGENPMRILTPVRLFVSILGRNAQLAMDRSEWAEAVTDLALAHQLARTVHDAKAPIDYAVMAASLLSRVNREIRTAAWHPGMDVEGIDRLLDELPAAEEMAEEFHASIRSDLHWFVRNEVARLEGPGGNSGEGRKETEAARDYDSGWQQADEVAESILEGHRLPFDRLETVRAAQRLYLELAGNVKRPWSSQSEVERTLGELVKDWPRMRLAGFSGESPAAKAELAKVRPALLASKNPYGRLAIWYFVPMTPQSLQAPFRYRADLEATRLMLFLRRFELTQGRLPEQLPELVKVGWFPEIPKDPFSGKPFRYDFKTRRLWSVGPNGKDDGGKGSPSLAARSLDYVYWPRKTKPIGFRAGQIKVRETKPAPGEGPERPKLEFLRGNAG